MKKAQLFFVFAAFLGVVFGFQNCSAPLPEDGTANNSSLTSQVHFAFDTTVDQVAYMSCHQLGSSFDRSSYFTFRVGAYNPSSGVGLTPEFVADSAKHVDDLKNVLTTDPVNAGALPVLSIRQPSNMQSMYVVNGSPSQGVDYAPLLTTLSSDAVADPLVKNIVAKNYTARIQYERSGLPEGFRVEGDLNLNTGLTGLNNAQQTFNSGGVLAINYPVKTSNIFSIRAPGQYRSDVSPATATTMVYGTGLAVAFKRNPSASTTFGQPWVLASVSPQPLGMTTPQQALSCPSTLIFKIADLRHLTSNATNTDTSKIYCETKPDNPAALSASDKELLRRARLSLRIEDWFIDWTRKCIVPKKFGPSQTQCYGSPTSTVPVEYDLTKDCNASPSTDTIRACAAFASICIR